MPRRPGPPLPDNLWEEHTTSAGTAAYTRNYVGAACFKKESAVLFEPLVSVWVFGSQVSGGLRVCDSWFSVQGLGFKGQAMV